MKTFFRFFALAICLATIAISCQKNPEAQQIQEKTPNLVTLTCAFPTMSPTADTKVSFAPADGTTNWEDGDKLLIFGLTASEAVVHTLSSAEIVDPKKAVFTEDLSGVTVSKWGKYPYNVAYPYDPENIPFTASTSDDSGRARFHNTNQHLMAGYIDGDEIVLYNLNAAILFKVDGDYDSYNFIGADGSEIVGYSDYLCQMNASSPIYRKKYLQSNGTAGPLTTISGTVNGDGSTYNYIYLPVNNSLSEGDDATAVDLPDGFTIQLKKSGVIKKYITSTQGVTMSPGHYIDLGLLPSAYIHDYEAIPAAEKASATELSNPKSANCYIVDGSDASNKNKVFKFPAVEGNTYVYGGAAGTSVGAAVSAHIIWETWNNAETVTANSVIKVVDFKDGFVYFKMPGTLHAGNALIAVKDSGETILWSWHIWVPDGLHSDISDAQFASTDIMSRNLGALVDATTGADTPVTSLGLLYQWGRKDPFPGFGANVGSTRATVNGTPTSKTTTKLTLRQSIQQPTCFVYPGKDDWFDGENDGTFWYTGTKKVYDPCPVNYRVADRASVIFWDGTNLVGNVALTQYDLNHSFTFNSLVFPYNGYITNDGGSPYKAGTRTLIWSSRWNSGTTEAYGFYAYNDDGVKFSRTSIYRSRGGAIRCVKE